jgi:putative chitinase
MINNLVHKLPSNVINELPLIIEKFAIDNPLRLAHFLAQCAHESADFKVVLENLNYGAKGLLSIFPKYFNAEDALLHERKPQEIANIVYANRMGNTTVGDGWKYRGRGYIQLTGHDNYAAFDKVVDDDILSNPDLVATKYPLLSAAWFWDKVNLNPVADLGNTIEVVTKVTKKVNGGTNGLDSRIKEFEKFYSILT